MADRNLVYLSYGNESEYKRSIFSLLSFYAWSEDFIGTTRVIIYTDAPQYFQSFFKDKYIEYHFLSAELLKEMRGADDFIHRIKVSVIKSAFDRYPAEQVLFVDSDTFFTSATDGLLNGIGAGKSMMHLREYDIEEGLVKFTSYNQASFPTDFIAYIRDRDFSVGGERMRFSVKDYSWNSGVLGLHSDFSAYMPDLLVLTDQFYANSRWFIAEQLAFSFILQRKTQISPADSYVLHYWGRNQKELMDKLLAGYLQHGNAGKLKDSAKIRKVSLEWKKAVEIDMILEQVAISVQLKLWVAAAKKSIQFVLKNQFNMNLYKKLIVALRPKVNTI